MLLPGSLKETTLGDLLGHLYRGRVSGVLELISLDKPFVGSSHQIHFVNGLVSSVSTPMNTTKIGELLYRQRQLSKSEYDSFVREIRHRRDVRAGELLMKSWHITPELLSDSLTLQNQQRLSALFSLERATIRFHPQRASFSSNQVEPRALQPSQFLHGARRARDDKKVRGQRDGFLTTDRKSDPWTVLGLQPGASARQVRSAFRALALELHPDLNQNLQSEALRRVTSKFAEVTAAYQTLIAARTVGA